MHKRKHHRKPKVIRDPQQIKRVRIQRLNVKRQACWDARFIKETIPDLFARRPKLRKADRTLNVRTPLESVYVDKERSRFPDIQQDKMRNTVSTNKRKSFKIRQIRKQGDQSHKDKPVAEDKVIIAEKIVEKQVKKVDRTAKNKQRLMSKLQQKTNLFPINGKYNQLLIDLIQRSTQKRHKNVRSIIQKEISSIGTEDNVYKKLEKMVELRRSMLADLGKNNEQTKVKPYIDFQMHSLSLIEQILKFKAFWEAIYSDNLHRPTRIHFYYDGGNYLAKITEEVREITESDPFLVERTAKVYKLNASEGKDEEVRERKEMMLKIRACQLLLIEEELLAGQ